MQFNLNLVIITQDYRNGITAGIESGIDITRKTLNKFDRIEIFSHRYYIYITFT
jgi:hypothetical protein